MTRPWWSDPAGAAALQGGKPVLLPGGRHAAIEALHRRIAGFVPEWRDLSEEDAGVALVKLFEAQLDPVLTRVARLPDKLLREFLSSAGIALSPPRSAHALIQFTPKERNEGPVNVPAGFRLTSPRADGKKGEVTWEIDESLTLLNCAIEELRVHNGSTALAVQPGEPFPLLGERPEIGASLYLGFAGSGELSGTLSLGFAPFSKGVAKPAAAGAGAMPIRRNARLIWEALTQNGFETIDVISDRTDFFSRDGIIRLALPREWAKGRPDQVGDGEDRHWLRLRLASGSLTNTPEIASVTPHVVGATAQETFREEFPVPENDDAGSSARLTHAPVKSGSVILEVDEGASGAGLLDESEERSGDNGTYRRWKEVPTLAGASPDGRVFTLDSATGTIRFGDGINGAAPPPGIRNIAVRSYATTSGAAGNVDAGAIAKMPSNLKGVDSVSNPAPASGGVDAEMVQAAEARGPTEIKARGRSVTLSDTELLAQEAEGADVLRAYALSGVDPAYPGAQIPGTIGLFVIPHRHPSEPKDAPPSADSTTLRALAEHLAGRTGPLGARISAGNPHYHQVGIEGTIALAAGADAGSALTALDTALHHWLSPETADPVHGWWSIGATLRHADLSHLVLAAHPDIVAAPYLAFRVDGVRKEPCADARLSRFGLPWPDRHRLLAEFAENEA